MAHGRLQFWWIARCVQAVEQYEELGAATYDFLVRTRPDVAYFTPLPPLRTLDLCSPRNASAGAAAPVPAGTTSGIPLGLPSARPLRPGRLMVAPTWLASLGNDPEEGWAAAEPPGGGLWRHCA